MEPERILRRRDGAGLAAYFKSVEAVAPGTFKANPWFDSAVASKWHPHVTFEEFRPALDAIYEVCKEEDGEWLFPLLGAYAQKLRKLAGKDTKKLQATKELFDSIFRSTIAFARKARTDSIPPSNLPLLLVTELMRIYVLIGSDSMARSLIGTVEHPTFPAMDTFSTPRRVIYSYYVGRSAVLEGNPADAVGPLTYAWNAIGSRHERNRSRVFNYLVPAELALGKMPSQSKLGQIENASPVLGNLIRAIANGNVRLTNQILEDNADSLCRLGTYVLLTRCKTLALRNLVKNCVEIFRETCDPSERNKVPLSVVLPAIKRWDDYEEERDGDLLEHTRCKLVNLISKGFIKGYISFQHNVVVVSANEAFPKTSIVLAD